MISRWVGPILAAAVSMVRVIWHGEDVPPFQLIEKSVPFTNGPETGVTPSEAYTWAVTVGLGSKAHMPAGILSVIVVFHASLPPLFWTLMVKGALVPTFRFVIVLLLSTTRLDSPIVIIGSVVPGIASRSVMLVVLMILSNHILAVFANCFCAVFAELLSRTTVRSISTLFPAGIERRSGLFSYEKTRCVESDKMPG